MSSSSHNLSHGTLRGIIEYKNTKKHYGIMPFTKKFPNAGETVHIRVPKCYKESVIDLCIALDSKFQQDVTKGNTIIRKFIRNSLSQ